MGQPLALILIGRFRRQADFCQSTSLRAFVAKRCVGYLYSYQQDVRFSAGNEACKAPNIPLRLIAARQN